MDDADVLELLAHGASMKKIKSAIFWSIAVLQVPAILLVLAYDKRGAEGAMEIARAILMAVPVIGLVFLLIWWLTNE